MTRRLVNVCEQDGECQEDAVVHVSVWRRSTGTPVAVLRTCAGHGEHWIRLTMAMKDWDIRVDQGVQLALF